MLPSRSIQEVREAAERLGLRLVSTPEDLQHRLSVDDATVETLRSLDVAAPATADLGGVHDIPPLEWGARRERPTPPGAGGNAPRDDRTWITVFDAPRLVPGGPLTGFEVGIKDLMAVEGSTVTAGTRAHQANASDADAVAVDRLRQAGATVRGTTNLHALAYGATGRSGDRGMPENPVSPGSITGGSSSGSAAAVANGSADLTLGTDTSGSIRIPAALCGVVGLKPTRGLVSLDGCHPLSPALDHIGPLARTVDVVGTAMAALVGWDDWQLPEDPTTTVRIGVLSGYFEDGVDAPVRAATREATILLGAAGAELDHVDLPLARHVPGAQLAILGSEALASNLQTLRLRGRQLPSDVSLRLEAGLARTPEQHDAALALRQLWRAQVDAALLRHHVLISPATAITAPPVDVAETQIDGVAVPIQFSLTRLTMPFNLSGHPAITLPFCDSNGTLMGVQLVGRRGGDQELLAVAAHVERLLSRSLR